MGFFGGGKKVSKGEFKKVRSDLASKGFTKRERNLVEAVFKGSLDERQASEKGIDSKELEKGVSYLRTNKTKFGLHSDKIDRIERSLKKHL